MVQLSRIFFRSNRLRNCSLALTLICLTAFGQTKKLPDFRQLKKSIDTLSFLTPQVVVESFSSNNRKIDTVLGEDIRGLLRKKIFTILSGKYTVEEISFSITAVNNEFTQFFNSICRAGSSLVPFIEIPSWLNKQKTSRYVLGVNFHGFYNGNCEPYYWAKASLRNNSVYINTDALIAIEMEIMLADKSSNRVLYYRKIKSKELDPRIPADVEKVSSDILKKIYYK